ncbi:MAG TPA: DUF5723 family protein, partial [Bacteroidia bacterium]|nr:DUF5723 family protein [Bacteroidia bacterium]
SVLSFGFSVLAENQYHEANVNYGKLFTDSQGLFVDGSVYAEYYSSDTANRAPFDVNGFGTSVDITWTYYGKTTVNTSQTFKLDILDFGFINWNNKTIRRYVDTTFHYEGVDVTPLFTNPDYVVELPDDGDFVKTDTSEIHRSIFLPGVVRATYTRSFFGRKLTLKALAAVPVWSYAVPFGSITLQYKIPRIKTAVSSGIAYGGYSRLQVPFKIDFYAVNNFSLDAGTTNLLVFFKPDELAGCGAFVKLTYCF